MIKLIFEANFVVMYNVSVQIYFCVRDRVNIPQWCQGTSNGQGCSKGPFYDEDEHLKPSIPFLNCY